MRRLVWSVLLLGSACANPQTTPHFELGRPLQLAGIEEFSPEAPAVIVSDRRLVRHYLNLSRYGANPLTKVDTYRAILIRNEAGLAHADVHIPPDEGATPQQVRAATILPSGERVPVPADSIRLLAVRWLGGGTPLYYTVISFPEATPGAILEYRYFTRANGIRSFDHYEPARSLPVMAAEYVIKSYAMIRMHRRNRSMECFASGTTGVPQTPQLVECTASYRQTDPRESFTSPDSSRSPFVSYVVQRFEYNGRAPSDPILPDWGAAAENLEKELAKAREFPKEHLEIHANAKTVDEKIASVWRWVQREVRIVDVRYQSSSGFRPVSEIHAHRNAMVDARARLIEAILRALDVPAEIMVVSGGRQRRPSPDHADPSFFFVGDWVVKVGEVILDPYCTGCEPGGIAPRHVGRRAVTMGGEVVELRGIVDGAATPPKVEYHLQLSKRGLIVERGTYTMSGSAAGDVRWYYFQNPIAPRHLRKKLQRRYLDGIEGGDIAIEGLDRDDGPVRIHLRRTLLSRSGYVHAGDLLMVPVDAVFPAGWMYGFERKRERPVEFTLPPSFENRFSFELRGTAKLVDRPVPTTARSKFGRYELRFETSGKTVTVAEKLSLEKQTIPIDDYPEFFDFIRSVREARARNLIVEGVGGMTPLDSSES